MTVVEQIGHHVDVYARDLQFSAWVYALSIEALDGPVQQRVHSARGILRVRFVDVMDTRCETLKIEDLLVISILDDDDVSSVLR